MKPWERTMGSSRMTCWGAPGGCTTSSVAQKSGWGQPVSTSQRATVLNMPCTAPAESAAPSLGATQDSAWHDAAAARQAERALSQVSMMTPPTQEDTSCRRHLGLVTTC